MFPMVNPLIIRRPPPKANPFSQKAEVSDAQEPLLTSMEILAVPDGTCTAFVTRIITDCALAVKRYQISSLAVVEPQIGAGNEAEAFTVVAVVELLQLVPNAVVVIVIAPLHSLFAGACPID